MTEILELQQHFLEGFIHNNSVSLTSICAQIPIQCTTHLTLVKMSISRPPLTYILVTFWNFWKCIVGFLAFSKSTEVPVQCFGTF